MFLFETHWTEAFRLLMPWAGTFFKFITCLGADYFFVLLIATWYWVKDKRASIIAAFVLIVSVSTNYWLKGVFRYPRPPSGNWLPSTHTVNYSLPSGHAQNSTILWGWMSLKFKKIWMTVLSAVLIVLIGLSRIYIGVHWLGDVILGWVVGLLLMVLMWKVEEPLCSILSKYNPYVLYLGLVASGIFAVILTEFLLPVNIMGLEDNFGANGGIIIGLGIGLILESRFVTSKIAFKSAGKWRIILRVFIGLFLVFAIMLVLTPILPTGVYWLRAIRYALLAIIVTFVWPWMFERLGF